jgi:heme exporter protein D
MKKSPHKISTMITTASTTVRQKRATKRWRERECKREERIDARQRG